ncbi:MAG: hypothetical protein V9G10_07455 [Candidatus Nanopelagicales bacterium]
MLPTLGWCPKCMHKTVVTTPQARAELHGVCAAGRSGWRLGEAAAASQPVWVGPAAGAPARVAHLLEELRRLRPAHRSWNGQLPAGVMAGDIAWPAAQEDPDRQPGQLRLRGHGAAAGAADHHAGLQAAARWAATLDVKLKASWLVCRQECIPEEGEFALQLAGAGLHRAARRGL